MSAAEISRWISAGIAYGAAPLVASVVARLPRRKWLGLVAGTAAGAAVAMLLRGALVIAV